MQRVALFLLAAAALGFLVHFSLQRGRVADVGDTFSTGVPKNSVESQGRELTLRPGQPVSTRQSALPAEPSAPAVDAAPTPTRGVAQGATGLPRRGDCWLTGRLLDPAGKPVSNVWVKSADESFGPRQHLPTNGSGVFGGWIPAVGEVTLWFSKNHVGQSEPLEVVALSGGSVDVGTVWLLEEGAMEGTVRLTDGHPVPGVNVTATAAHRDSLGGLGVSFSKTGDDGRFSIRGLARGEFTFQVAGDEPYPLTQEVRAKAGDSGLVLEVEALVFVTRCVKENGEPVLFRRLSCSARKTGGAEPLMWTFRKTPAAEVIVAHAPVGTDCMLQAEAEDGRVYTAFTGAALSAGQHAIDLRAESEALSQLTLRAPKLGAFEEGLLRVTSLKLDGEPLAISTRRSDFHPTHQSTILDGLPKGSYEVECSLGTSGFEILVDPVRRFDLAPPKNRVLTYETTLGGRLLLTFAAAPGHRGWMKSSVQIKREGAPDSSYTEFAHGVAEAQSFGRTMVAPGLPIRSRAFEPGRYQVRLECEGHLPKFAAVEVKAGVINGLEMALEADPDAQ